MKGVILQVVDGYELIERLKAKIDALPDGYISRKTIKGKTQYYRQWREDGKLRSKYIRESDVEEIRSQIEERKRLQEQLKELRKQFPEQKGASVKYRTNILTGDDLQRAVSNTHSLQKRDSFGKLQSYLQDENNWTRVCAVYGLRRTGKTTMLFQAIDAMSEEDRAKAAYTKIRRSNVMDDLIQDLKVLLEEGYKYVFVDEITRMEDFIDSAALLSDLYIPMGMRIVLSGRSDWKTRCEYCSRSRGCGTARPRHWCIR